MAELPIIVVQPEPAPQRQADTQEPSRPSFDDRLPPVVPQLPSEDALTGNSAWLYHMFAFARSLFPECFDYWNLGAATIAAQRGEMLGRSATLSDRSRAEFIAGLFADSRKTIDDKSTIGFFITGGIAFAILFGLTQGNGWLALLLAIGISLIFWWLVMLSMAEEELKKILGYGDEMLVVRYNQALAARRDAANRAAIQGTIKWGVAIIIVVIVGAVWLATRR